MENKYFVYALVDPINRLPFYIGKGCGNRPYHHLKKNRKELNIDKVKYIDNIRVLGHEPEVHYVATNLFEESAYSLELTCIKHGKAMGLPLTNKIGLRAPPRRKGAVMSEQAKQKIAAYQKGRPKAPVSDETKSKLSAALTGKRQARRLIIAKDNLMDLYITQNRTRSEIALLYGVSVEPINRLLKEYNIRKISN